ncbi:hypothetical protein B0H10DRAFT_1946271 [Mycena sp. CBHHK59/15]|nr:hypothetical protein B0H10DRAFT_1946271 [Mycena sp. CBHHK59/15]
MPLVALLTVSALLPPESVAQLPNLSHLEVHCDSFDWCRFSVTQLLMLAGATCGLTTIHVVFAWLWGLPLWAMFLNGCMQLRELALLTEPTGWSMWSAAEITALQMPPGCIGCAAAAHSRCIRGLQDTGAAVCMAGALWVLTLHLDPPNSTRSQTFLFSMSSTSKMTKKQTSHSSHMRTIHAHSSFEHSIMWHNLAGVPAVCWVQLDAALLVPSFHMLMFKVYERSIPMMYPFVVFSVDAKSQCDWHTFCYSFPKAIISWNAAYLGKSSYGTARDWTGAALKNIAQNLASWGTKLERLYGT